MTKIENLSTHEKRAIEELLRTGVPAVDTEEIYHDNRPWDFIVRRHSDGDLQVIDESGEVSKGGDVSAFQTLLNTVSPNGDTVGVFVDSLDIDGQIDATELSSVSFIGKSFNGRPTIKINTSSSPVFDWTGSIRINWENVQFRVETGATPDVVHLQARVDGGADCNRWKWENVLFTDPNDNLGVAMVYNFGAELQSYQNCEFDVGGAASVVLTQTNVDGVSSPNVTEATGSVSTTEISFDNCDFYANGNSGIESVEIEQCGDIHFARCFFGGPGDRYNLKLRNAATSGAAVTRTLAIRDSRFEARVITSETPSGDEIRLINFSQSGGTIGDVVTATGPLWDLDKDDGSGNGIKVFKCKFDRDVYVVDLANTAHSLDLHILRGGYFGLDSEKTDDVALNVSDVSNENEIVIYDSANFSAGGTSVNNDIREISTGW